MGTRTAAEEPLTGWQTYGAERGPGYIKGKRWCVIQREVGGPFHVFHKSPTTVELNRWLPVDDAPTFTTAVAGMVWCDVQGTE